MCRTCVGHVHYFLLHVHQERRTAKNTCPKNIPRGRCPTLGVELVHLVGEGHRPMRRQPKVRGNHSRNVGGSHLLVCAGNSQVFRNYKRVEFMRSYDYCITPAELTFHTFISERSINP